MGLLAKADLLISSTQRLSLTKRHYTVTGQQTVAKGGSPLAPLLRERRWGGEVSGYLVRRAH